MLFADSTRRTEEEDSSSSGSNNGYYIPSGIVAHLYDPAYYNTIEEGRKASRIYLSDQMSSLSWSTKNIVDNTLPKPESHYEFEGSGTYLSNTIGDSEFSVSLKPSNFIVTTVTSYFTPLYDYIDDLGGWIGACELVLGLVAVVYWVFSTTALVVEDALDGDSDEEEGKKGGGEGGGGG